MLGFVDDTKIASFNNYILLLAGMNITASSMNSGQSMEY